MTLNTIIIDDSFFVRETLSKMIADSGHNVIKKYNDGKSILEDLNNINADVFFLDIILPDLSGLEVLPKIRERFPNGNIVMLSGMTQGNTVAAALQLGATDFVSKPISKDQLSDLLSKFSANVSIPSVEELSTIGVSTFLINMFISELAAHASASLREIIFNQARSILEYLNMNYSEMFVTDLEKITIEPNPELWGKYSEEEVINKLAEIPVDLSMEVSFLYPEDFINDLYDQAILTMASRSKIVKLFELVPPSKIGLPELPSIDNISDTPMHSAGTTFEELEKAIAISAYLAGSMGPQILANIDAGLVDEHIIMRNAIFYSTLSNANDENFQEGLFGPLPVSSTSEESLSSLVYTLKMRTVEDDTPALIMLTFYFTPTAEKIISNYSRLSFIIKTRLANINYAEELDRVFIRNLLNDAINFILE